MRVDGTGEGPRRLDGGFVPPLAPRVERGGAQDDDGAMVSLVREELARLLDEPVTAVAVDEDQTSRRRQLARAIVRDLYQQWRDGRADERPGEDGP